MGKPNPITYKGVTYPTRKDLAAAFSVPYGTLIYRISIGWSLQKAVTQPVGAAPTTSRSIIFRDRSYVSKTALCRAYGVDYAVFLIRLKRGWTMEQALGLEPRANLPADTCKGKVYKITNIKTGRCYIGLTTKKLSVRWQQHVVKSKTSNSKLSLAIRHFGPENFTIKILARASSLQHLAKLERKFIKKYKAFSRGYNSAKGGNLGGGGIDRPNKVVRFQDKVYPSVAALCRAFNVPRSRFEARYKLGWTLKQALGVESRHIKRTPKI